MLERLISALSPDRRRCVRRIRWFSLLFLAGFLALPTFAQKKLSASEAKEHFGETATVCGEVVSTRYADSTKGQPTFLNLDKPYPNQIFTVDIWGINRSKFGSPEIDKNRCGKVAAQPVTSTSRASEGVLGSSILFRFGSMGDLVQVFAIKFI